ncbi:SDR family NAD(P)-dependent oxidoreductase [Miltoncostaea marina]|uniref:SDR family NAD(P)-dependent oxidoreductase n=1 Tax=Miltoncostaea marina TaxID=2843215 RepID=UPI001C3D3FDD|nr:SDR family NAD(P)-dependent oxidoreductase [Miltoncostaea marina]
MSSPLAGRRALITGGSRRVGRALSLELAAMGIDLAIHHRASEADAEATAAECREAGVRAVVLQADLGTAAACRALVAAAQEALGGVDVLVNSASNFLPRAFEDVSEDEMDLVLSVNLKAPFMLAQAAAPAMAAAGWGRIVNLSDVAGLEPWPRFTAHSVAKAGMVMLTRCLAQELAPAVTVNAIAPGTVLMPDGSSEAATRRSSEKAVLGRVGTPGDVAGAMRYLLEAPYVTGHTLVVDGGRLVRP